MRKALPAVVALAVATSLGMPATALADRSFYRELYPTTYFLTNLGQVTPVKLQSPWEDCWAFAMASAIESSILKAEDAAANGVREVFGEEPATTFTAEGVAITVDPFITPWYKTAASTPQLTNLNESIDVSERALAWFAHQPQTEESSGSQAGEGYYLLNPTNRYNQLAESNFEIVESQLMAGQSLLSEASVPYQYNDYNGNPGWWNVTLYTGSANDPRTHDWSVEDSLRTVEEVGWRVDSIFKLESPAVLEYNAAYDDYKYTGYYAPGTRAIKGALMDIGAVAIALESDVRLPSEIAAGRGGAAAGAAEHLNYATWSQYNADEYVFNNHAVAIVGWDDTYSADNFAGTVSGRPPGDGAWLCKNNWGSDALYEDLGATQSATHWGLTDASGAATGFFWLSYYDHSIANPTAFGVEPVLAVDAAVGEVTQGPAGYKANDITIYQYDYLGSAEYRMPPTYAVDVWVANAFTAESTEMIREVTAQTFEENQTVEVQIYLVSDDVDLVTSSARDIFGKAKLIAQDHKVFPHAGFHHMALDSPIFISAGKRFIVAERITGAATDPSGYTYEANYLNLELAFDEPATANATTAATVVANPGETFVQVDGAWESIEDFNRLHAEANAETGGQTGLTFGNALVKVYTAPTTMDARGQVYETVELGRVSHVTDHTATTKKRQTTESRH